VLTHFHLVAFTAMTDGMDRAAVLLVLALVLWASAFVGIRVAVEHYPPGALALVRFLVASVLLVGYMRAVGYPSTLRRARRSDWAGFLALGFTGIFVYHAALNTGERTVTAGVASLLVNTTPVFTVLLAASFLGDRPGRRGALGMAIAFSGAALVSLGAGGNLQLEIGAVFVLVAAVSQALYFIIQKGMLERYGPLELTTVSTVCGCLMLSIFTPELIDAVRVSPHSATLVALYLGVGPSAVAYLGWAHVVSEIPVSRAVSFLYLVPVLAFLIGWMVLGETPTAIVVVGGAATIAGVVLVHRRSR